MQMTAKRRSQPWWMILLLTPILVSCIAVPVAFWEVSLYVGASIVGTATGQFVEQVVDNLVERTFDKSSPGYVIPDPENPLHGTYSKKMKFTITDLAGKSKSFEINKPRMYRNSETSKKWELAPGVKESVAQKLEGGA